MASYSDTISLVYRTQAEKSRPLHNQRSRFQPRYESPMANTTVTMRDPWKAVTAGTPTCRRDGGHGP